MQSEVRPRAFAATERCRGPALRRSQNGFTLVELIMVIVMMGVLAVFAAPRLFDSTDFYARGFHDETLALLRYAQKAAVAQRRLVCVSLTLPEPAMAKLSIASEPAPGGCDISLTGPSANCPGGPSITAFPNDKQGLHPVPVGRLVRSQQCCERDLQRTWAVD
ncbi:MAG: type II secretion system protein [Comamonadaceae bacterium]|nr:type II secretion system protein [Comamonadaceae bacterium]